MTEVPEEPTRATPATTLPAGRWFIVAIPERGAPSFYEYDRYAEFHTAAHELVAAREDGRFQGTMHAFVGQYVDLQQTTRALRMHIDTVGTLEAAE